MVWAAIAGLNVSAVVGRAIGTTSFAETETGTPPASPDREGGLIPPFELLPPSLLSLRLFLFACESPIATMRTSAMTRNRGLSHHASFLRRCCWCFLPLSRRLPPWGPVLRSLLEREWSGLAAEDE